MAAIVDKSKCTGCGLCIEVCPVEAITVDEVATVDAATCIDCSACVRECPNGALYIEGLESVSSAPRSSPLQPSLINQTQDNAAPNPSLNYSGQRDYQPVNRGGLLGQIFDFFSRPSAQGQGQGRGGGRGQGRGMGMGRGGGGGGSRGGGRGRGGRNK